MSRVAREADATANTALPKPAAAVVVADARSLKTGRIQTLDVLRGLAAFVVLFSHYGVQLHKLHHPEDGSRFGYTYGHYAVGLFFMISGFVILMSAEKLRRPRDFAISRFTRLFPAYWACLILTFVVMRVLSIGKPPSLARLVANFSMVQGWFRIGHVDGVYWSLQVELSFYLLVLLLLAVRSLHAIGPVLIGLTLVSLVDRALASPWSNPLTDWLRMVLILEHVPQFTIGVMLYLYWLSPRNRYLLVIPVCWLLPAIGNREFSHPLQDTLVTIGMSLLMFATVQGWLRFLSHPVLIFLGTISYPFYLLHNQIGITVIARLHQMQWNALLSVPIAVALIIGLSAAMTFLIEKPAMAALRKRWLPRKPPHAAPDRSGQGPQVGIQRVRPLAEGTAVYSTSSEPR